MIFPNPDQHSFKKQEYEQRITTLLTQLPNNSLIKKALLAIQSGQELPTYTSGYMKNKIEVLRKEYQHPQIPLEDLEVFQHIFQSCIQQKVEQVQQLQDTPLQQGWTPVELERFSPAEIEKILNIQDRYELSDDCTFKYIATLAECKSLEELSKCEQLFDDFIDPSISYSIKEKMIFYLSLFVQEKPIEELEEWKKLFFLPITCEVQAEEMFLLIRVFMDKSLEESQYILQRLQSMTPIGLVPKQNLSLRIGLLQAIKNRPIDQVHAILDFITNIIPNNLSPQNTLYLINSLSFIISNKSWELVAEYFTFFSNLVENLPEEKKFSIIYNFAKTLERISWQEFLKLQKFIRSFLPPDLLTTISGTEATAYWMRFCSKENISIFLNPKYARHSHSWMINALPLLIPDLTPRTTQRILDELVPPKIDSEQEASRLSRAVAPFFNVNIITDPSSPPKLFRTFKDIPLDLCDRYGQLADRLLKLKPIDAASTCSLISWIQETNPQNFTEEEFFAALRHQLNTLTGKEQLIFAQKIVKYQKFWNLEDSDPLIQEAKWPISYDAYKLSLEEKLKNLPMSTSTVDALSGKAFTAKDPKSLIKAITDLHSLLSNIENYTVIASQQSILQNLFEQKIQEKIEEWNSLTAEEQQGRVESSFSKGALIFPNTWQTLSFEKRRIILQAAELLVDADMPAAKKQDVLLVLTDLILKITSKDYASLLEFLEKIENMKLYEKIDILNLLQKNITKFSSIADLEKIITCVSVLISEIDPYEEKKELLCMGIEGFSSSEDLDCWVQLVSTAPSSETFARLMLHIYKPAHPELSESLLLSLIRKDMSVIIIKTILTKLNEERHPAKVAKALSPFIKVGMSLPSIKLLFITFERVPWKLQIPYSRLIASLLGPKASASDVCSLIHLALALEMPSHITVENFYDYLNETMQNCTQYDSSLAEKCSRKIFDCQHALHISDSSPLMQNAINAILQFGETKSQAYFLQAQIKQKKLSCPSIAQTISPTWIPHSKDSYPAQIELDLQGLQRGCDLIQTQKKTYGELKEWIEERNRFHQRANPDTLLLGPSFFQDFFGTILRRLDNQLKTNPAHQAQIEELRHEIAQTSLNFTYEDYLVKKVMKSPILEDHAQVPQITLRLYAIADAILQQEPIFSDGALLSIQEQQGLAWLSVIEHCSVGQEQGISLCYHGLQMAGIIRNSRQSTAVESESTQLYLAETVQQAMHEVIKSPEILRHFGVSENEILHKGVHQELYLQNMIGPECGLDHQETMDPFPREISNQILLYDRKYLLQVFFYHLSHYIVSCLRESVNTVNPALKNKRYNFLTAYLTDHKIDPQKAWALQDHPPRVCFTLQNREVPITLETVKECLSMIPSEPELWTQNDQGIQLTSEGTSQFLSFLQNNVEDPSLIDSTGQITERHASEFLHFVENYKKSAAKKRLYDPETHQLTSLGVQTFKQALEIPSSPFYIFVNASFRQSKEKTSWEDFVAGVIQKIKNYPAIRQYFLQTYATCPMPWSIKEQSRSYELTEFGALALLEKEGYIHTRGPYANYLRVTNELYELSILRPLQKTIQRIQAIPKSYRTQQDIQKLEEAQAQLAEKTGGKDLNLRVQYLENELSLIKNSLLLQVPDDLPPPRPSFLDRLL